LRRKNTGSERGRRAERGQVLVLVILVLLVVAVLGSAVVTLAASHRLSSARQASLVQAYYAADAGAERVLARIRHEPGWFDGLPFNDEQTVFSHVPYAGGEIQEVTLKKVPAGMATRVEITSLGIDGPREKPLARKTLEVCALVFPPSDLLRGVSILPENPTSLSLKGNFFLEPAEGVGGVKFVLNGDLDLGGNSYINGDAYASGTVEVGGAGEITGEIHEHYPGIPAFPVIEEEWYRTEAKEKGQHYPGDAVLGGKSGVTSYAGIYFAEGTIEISGEYSGRAVIVAKGGITVEGDLEAQSENDLLVLISLADVSIKNFNVDAVVIAADTFKAWGNATLNGALIARGLDLPGAGAGAGAGAGTVEIVCNPGRNLPPEVAQGVPPSIKIESWRERYPVL